MTAPDASPPTVLYLPRVLEAALWAHARRDAPAECVGAIGGHERPDGLHTQALYPLPNIAPDPARQYLADPGHLLRALRAMQAEGLSLIALYHSHPKGPATPSSTDTQLAAYSVPYLIADLRGGSLLAYSLPDCRAVKIVPDGS
ncbi:Mov34/MPN/PAD-1 family protein [Deinococcus sp. QL22]|uniref:Mov34/MPN/PAD-1 family protein n=1 Tax=Deinococcus sp. QL22 TaxID=2939437 RepID=UPI002017B5C7|nr:M67 family metallopeptidase [Deinococcus sp. QL22]UQN06669.1 M67 family metallopeptidase [Deinococcus sp. QL22]